MKVAVAMSGGVDSSVVAALLKKDGHDVIGITMRLYDQSTSSREINTIERSKTIAEKLGISHVVADFRDIFNELIIDDFCREYRLGRTPSPCIRCNKYIKFGALMEKARSLGADYIATGHYARVENDYTGRYVLKRGIDTQKDQSYFLCRLNQEQVSHALFPLGNMTKENVKKIAEELELPVNKEPESQEICFIPDNDYARFIEECEQGSVKPGPILNRRGDKIGRHAGLHRYTIGQRKGLGIAAAEPLYVTAIEADKNTVIVGKRNQIYGDELTAKDLHWIAGMPPKYPLKIEARIRYRHREAKTTLSPVDESYVRVKFDEPQMAITPGQTIVFYDKETVIGCGIINLQGSQ